MGAPHYRRISGAPGKREVLSNEEEKEEQFYILACTLYIVCTQDCCSMYTGLLL